jgi:hypothetical protein
VTLETAAARPDLVAVPERPFALHEGEPVLLRTLFRAGVRPRWLLLIVPVLVAILGLAAIVDGHLTQTDLGSKLCRDGAAYLADRTKDCYQRYQRSAEFSLARDLPTLLVALVLGLTPYLIYKQWWHLRKLLPEMRRARIAYLSESNLEVFNAEIDNVNSHCVNVSRFSALTMLISAMSVLFVAVAERQYGMFYRLAPQDDAGWVHRAYAGWWANFDTAPIAWIVYVLLGTIGVYFIVTMNLVGGRVVKFLTDTRNDVTYAASVENLDGYYGWSNARGVLVATYWALAIHGIGLALIAITLPFPISLVFLAPLFAQWILVLPIYVLVPITLMRRNIRRYKFEQLIEIEQRLAEAEEDDLMTRNELARRAEMVRSIRELPFARLRDILFLIFTLVAGFASIYSAL